MLARSCWRLEFGGSVVPDQEAGGWGCVLFDHRTRIFRRISARLGVSTRNVAEYHALIGGMRACLVELQRQSTPSTNVELHVRGDSKRVCEQMNGAMEVSDDILKLYVRCARSLVAMFGEVVFRHVPREENVDANALARAGVKRTCPPGDGYLVYYPSFASMSHVCIHSIAQRSSKWTVASNDLGTSRSGDEYCFIDAKFLASLSPDYMLQIRDPGSISWISAKIPMNVMGTVQLKIGAVPIRRDEGLPWSPEFSVTVSAVVVESLPVPFHLCFGDSSVSIHTRNSDFCDGADGMRTDEFCKDNVPSSFQDHAFWTSDVIFIGH